MDRFISLSLLFPALFFILLSCYKKELLHLIQHHLNRGSTYDLVIAVVSARDHFEQRQSIRNTWWGDVLSTDNLTDKISLHFVVGEHGCEIPLVDRDDPYNCELWNVSVPEITEGLISAKEALNEGNTTDDNNYPIQSISFRIQHPVIISRLGLHTDSLIGKAEVKLLDASSQTEIVSTVLSKESPGVLINGFRYKAVEPYLLPKGFEGQIVAENLQGSTTELPVTKRAVSTPLNNAGNLLKYIQEELDFTVDGHYTDPVSLHSNHIVIPAFIFSVHEVTALREQLESRPKRFQEWQESLDVEQKTILQEIDEHSDIVLVDVVDHYRNIPLKLLKYLSRISEIEDFKYILKTDDDCFVDVRRLYSEMGNFQNMSKLWWGRFRNNWAVDHYGKWAERLYKAPAYPRFACGSGSVLDRQLVDWLVVNENSLQTYQGEDISLGIWLSAIGPNYVDDFRWQCEKECLSDMMVVPELTVTDLYKIWTDKKTCGDPCGCT